MSFCFGDGFQEVDSKGAGVNDVPVARQSRDPALPQKGESTFPHQKKSDCESNRTFSTKFALRASEIALL